MILFFDPQYTKNSFVLALRQENFFRLKHCHTGFDGFLSALNDFLQEEKRDLTKISTLVYVSGGQESFSSSRMAVMYANLLGRLLGLQLALLKRKSFDRQADYMQWLSGLSLDALVFVSSLLPQYAGKPHITKSKKDHYGIY